MSSQIGVITFPGSNGDQDSFDAFAINLGVPYPYDRLPGNRPQWTRGYRAPRRILVRRPLALRRHCTLRAGDGFAQDRLRTRAARCSDSATGSRCSPKLTFCQERCCATNRCNSIAAWSTSASKPPAPPGPHEVSVGRCLNLPIAHGEGAYFADDATLERLEANGQIVFRYCDPDGTVTPMPTSMARCDRSPESATSAATSSA